MWHRQRVPQWMLVGIGVLCISVEADAGVACTDLLTQDFSATVDAPTHLTAVDVVERPQLPTYCRVQGYVAPQVGFELRMPVVAWNERLLFQGCGGFCGHLRQIEDCNDALARGYACVTTDLGHKSTPIDGKWAFNNREAEIDFYFRATHVTALAAKAILQRMRDRRPSRSYIRGCSTGGRQGLISAQRFPEDFDGVIAGAPAGVSSGGGLHLIWSALANRGAGGKPILAEADVATVHAAVLRACDANDGVEDGILADPTRCEFDPQVLACGDRVSNACLNPEQVATVQRIYSGALDRNGDPVYRSVPMPGSEPHWVPAYVRDDGPSIYYLFGGDFFRYLAFAIDPGPRWKPEDFVMERDLPRLRFMRMFNNAANPDLTQFRDRGGKIILYQGWSDESVPPLGIVEYLELATETLGGPDKTADLMRLYQLPGVSHCRGGKGADTLDLLTALEDWVERGQPPEQLVASKLKTTELGSNFYPLAPGNVDFQWLIAPYPGGAEPLR